MGACLDVTFKHNKNTAQPMYVSNYQIQKVAALARDQAGLGNRNRVAVDDLLAISDIQANGRRYAVEWSVDGPVTNENGEPVLGLCEYDPEGLPNTALIFANPDAVADHPELMISTLAHELGHGIFDVPAWIVASETSVLPGLLGPVRGQKFRRETPNERHISLGGAIKRQAPDFPEWRANEFMGSFLVPEALLAPVFRDIADSLRLPLQLDSGSPCLVPNATSDRPRLAPGRHGCALTLKIAALVQALAAEFGVSRRFMEVRLLRYGYVDDAQLASI